VSTAATTNKRQKRTSDDAIIDVARRQRFVSYQCAELGYFVDVILLELSVL
jgi:hypothetical protein